MTGQIKIRLELLTVATINSWTALFFIGKDLGALVRVSWKNQSFEYLYPDLNMAVYMWHYSYHIPATQPPTLPTANVWNFVWYEHVIKFWCAVYIFSVQCQKCISVTLPHSDLSWILSEVENLASLQELSIYLSLYLRVWHSQLSLLDITIREAR